MTARPSCPACGGPLETTADRGRYSRIAHWAICCTCRTEWMIRQVDNRFDYTPPTRTTAQLGAA